MNRSLQIPLKLIRSRYLLPISESFGKDARIEDGYVLYSNDEGMILEVGEFTEEVEKRLQNEYGGKSLVEVIGSPNFDLNEIPQLDCVCMPGFVKAHCHDEEPIIMGLARDLPLTEWLDSSVNITRMFFHDKYDEIVSEIGVSPYLLCSLKTRLDDIFYGITSNLNLLCNHNKHHVIDFVTSNYLAGTTGISAIGCADRHVPSEIWDTCEEAIERLEATKNIDPELMKNNIIFGAADQLFSNGPEILKKIKDWTIENDTYFHIHSSEEPRTTEWFTKKYGMTPIEYGQSIGILDERTMVAHQVNNTENDLNILAETDTKVCHNPLANTILGSGITPVLEMMSRGIDVSIGTDGTGSSDSQNILSAARCASQLQKAYNKDAHALPAQTCLEMITETPARSVGLTNKGSLEVGNDADLILIDLDRLSMVPTVAENVVENLIWASNGSEVRYVVAGGKMLMDDYKITSIDEREIKGYVRHLFDMFIEFRKTVKPELKTGSYDSKM